MELEPDGTLDLGKELSGRCLHLERCSTLRGLGDEYKRAHLVLGGIRDGLGLVHKLGDLGGEYKLSHGPGWYGILVDRSEGCGTVHVEALAESKLLHPVLCGSAVRLGRHDKLGGQVEWHKLLHPERDGIHGGLGLGDILDGNE